MERNNEEPEVSKKDIDEVSKILDAVEAEIVDAIFEDQNFVGDSSIDDIDE